MGNTLKIAGKEFKDLLSDRIMLVVVAAFLLYILVDLSHIRDLLASGFFNYDPNLNQANPAANLAETMLNQLTFMLSRYGAILGIAVGFLSIAGERHGGALNALVAKPVTRDAIIVGKTGGALGFLLCVFALAAAFLTSGLMILASATIA
ncbi:MAG TPA: ABC transporter permease subunit, partial [Methanocella sp.]|nr:ABC transporter permease subunit [Methanocella sp.]